MNDELPDEVLIVDEGSAGIRIVADEDVFCERVLPILARFRLSGRLAFDETASGDHHRLDVSGTT